MSGPRGARRYIQLGIGFALSGLFLYLALRGEDWQAVQAALAEAKPIWLLPMFFAGIYALYVRCQRWQILIERSIGRPCPMGPIFSASAIGFMANMVLPFRVGEVARPYLVSRHTDVPLTTCFATVVVERILDLATLFIFALGIVLTSPVPPLVRTLTALVGAIAGVVFVGAVAVVVNRERLVPLLDQVWRRLPEKIGEPLLRLEHEFLDGVAPIAHPATFLRTLVWSGYVWLVIATTFSLGFFATGIEAPFFRGGIIVTTLVALAVSVPSAPAFVGQFEWGCKLALEQVMGVPGARAVGYAILVHVTQFTTQVALGVVYLIKEGLSFSDLGQMAEEDAAAEVPPA